MCEQKQEAQTKIDMLIAAIDRLTKALEENRSPATHTTIKREEGIKYRIGPVV